MLELCTSGCGWSVYRNIRWGPEKPHRMSWGVKILTVSEQWIHKWKETMFKVLNKPSCIIFSVIDLSCMYAVFHQAFLCNTLFMRCKFYTHSDMDHKTIGFWASPWTPSVSSFVILTMLMASAHLCSVSAYAYTSPFGIRIDQSFVLSSVYLCAHIHYSIRYPSFMAPTINFLPVK